MQNIFSIITSPEKRYYGFDIIRAFSVMLVIHLHFLQLICPFIGLNYFHFPLPDPVDMFFVCSGFLIGYNFLIEIHKTEKIDAKFIFRFLIMRWGRTLPAYFIMLILLTVIVSLVTKKVDIPYSNFFFLQNFVNNQSDFYKETWTISVEEWFYVLFPLGFMFGLKFIKSSKDKSFLAIILFMLLGSLSLKVFYYFFVFTKHTFVDFVSHYRLIVVLRLDTIAIGLLAAYICYHYENFWFKYRYKFLVVGVAIYLFSTFYSWAWSNQMIPIEVPSLKQLPFKMPFAYNTFSTFYHYVFFYFVSPISIALCLPYLKTIQYKPTFVNKVVMYISFISYSIFLLHYSFLLTLCIGINAILFHSILFTYVFWLIVLFLLSHFFYLKIELPFMKKRKWLMEKFKLID
ncbi:MAG: acyltransferase [Chitinophagales bacterium]|nr:acyltransferase [Saprospirales bacterium]MBP6660009.1 acyltransferase [Chitinophagales bacterium]